MLTALSIRDIVLIEKLDIGLEKGLTVLTGETGAGKSILLDSLGLALGARGDSSLVRAGAERGVVTAAFALPKDHEVFALLREQGIDAEGELVIRRIQNTDGPSRASINEQPVSLNLLRQIAGTLAEIHGQHADRALVDVSAHRRLLDAFGGLDKMAGEVAALWEKASAAKSALEDHRALMARAEAERDYLEHALEELRALDPLPGEEAKLARALGEIEYAASLDMFAEKPNAVGDDVKAWQPTAEPLATGWAARLLLARAAASALHRDQLSPLWNLDNFAPLITGPPWVRALEELAADNRRGDLMTEAAGQGVSFVTAMKPARQIVMDVVDEALTTFENLTGGDE